MTTSLVRISRNARRILAIPLGFQQKESGVEALTFYHFQLSVPTDDKGIQPATSRIGRAWGDISTWAQTKVEGMWSSLGRAEAGSFRRKAFQAGERLMNTQEFEEIALKNAFASLRSSKDTGGEKLEVPLVYPSSITSGEAALQQLRQFADARSPIHRKGLYTWSAVIPFTVPLKLIPVIPNFPFFFSAWKLISHYRAYKTSQNLQSILGKALIVPESSQILDEIYRKYPSSSPFSAQHTILLSKAAIPALVEQLHLDGPQDSADLDRAFDQVQERYSSSNGNGN
ncbi:hypothetical protein FA15DRAFT_669964 [Coprinopsis marcescibilis]|uniref:Mitochondrial K+-H+ exchange-related-domain-containing protein n=1 Tax=Coprinopsis marcescibilis TaxID=230819 RepID=A0A5C3KTX4_COPMA|nr:hypothetical protein FA15DRAFT_669964 [Coprinopsis marcescibilis]